ncbi:ligand-dependent nuclear receptor-interacting factor 1 [Gastrophryne carolinensis]
MSNLQIPVVNQAHVLPTSQCLTGGLYHIVQSPGPQGKNVLSLIPVLNSKDNTVPVVAAPTIPNARTLNIQQPVRVPLPSPVSNVSLPFQVNSQLVQQIGTGKYIITTQKSPVEAPKTIRVNNPLAAPPGTAVVLEKTDLTLPLLPKQATQTIIMMDAKSRSVPVKTVPYLPSGHGLQIPAHAEVKTVPVSSLPLSIQQRILPQLNFSDTTKIPSVVYVSPVNTVKAPSNPIPKTASNDSVAIAKSSPSMLSLPSTMQPGATESPKAPMKWVVHEGKESAACIVPVTSSNNTASKLLKLMSGTKPEDMDLTDASSSSKMVQIKDNALVVCNNKIYLLTKQGAELRKADGGVEQEMPSSTTISVEQKKEPSIRPTEAAAPRNVSPATPVTTVNTSEALISPPALQNAAKSTYTPSKTNGNESEVIYIDDDDDDDVLELPQKPAAPSQMQELLQKPAAPLQMQELPHKPPAPSLMQEPHQKPPSQMQELPQKPPAPSQMQELPQKPPASSHNCPDNMSYENMSLMQPVTPLASTVSGSNRTGSVQSQMNKDCGLKRKADQLHGQPNQMSSIKVCYTAAAPLVCRSKSKEDQLPSQPNQMSSIKVCSTAAPLVSGSNSKEGQLHSQLNQTGTIKVCYTPAPLVCGSKRKEDQLHSQPNTTSLIKVCSTVAPVISASKSKEDTLLSQANTSLIKVCSAAPLVSGSKSKADKQHSQPNTTNLIKVCSTAAPMVYVLNQNGQLQSNKTSPIKLSSPAAPMVYVLNQNGQLQSQPSTTSSFQICPTAAPLVWGSNQNGQLYSKPSTTSPIKICSTSAPQVCGSLQNGQLSSKLNKTRPILLCSTRQLVSGSKQSGQVKGKEEQCPKIPPVPKPIDDKTLRVRFGLVKKEKIILKRLPLLRLGNPSNATGPSVQSDVKACAESPNKRKSSEKEPSGKRRKSADLDWNKNYLADGDHSASASSTTAALYPVTSPDVTQTSSRSRGPSPSLNKTVTNGNHTSPSVSEMYTEQSDSVPYDYGQDIAPCYSEPSTPIRRFFLDNPAYADETTKDEKIQRLKEVLREREQALEALRRLKRT